MVGDMHEVLAIGPCLAPINVRYSYQYRESKPFVTRKAIVVIVLWQAMSLDSLDCTCTIDPVKFNTNNQLLDYTSLGRKFLDMDTGCDVIGISDISGTIDIGIPLLPADSPCRASLEDRTSCSQSDRRPAFDIEDSKVFSAQVEPVKSIELATDNIEAQSW